MPTRLLIGSEVLDPDVTITEQYLSPALITSHPVEGGGEITDHVQALPKIATLEFVISETPLRQPVFGADGVTLVTGNFTTLTGSLADRARLFVDRLEQTRTLGELITLDSARRGRIENFALQSVGDGYTSTRDAKISVTLKQIVVADARTVAIPPTAEPRGKKKSNKGKQPAAKPTETEKKSALAKMADSTAGRDISRALGF